jgi:ubiquitin C-terminal hydrolase
VLEEVESVVMDQSMLTEERLKSRLDLYDCLQAFSSREELDQNNPWFCPVCRRHQTASKTLSGNTSKPEFELAGRFHQCILHIVP